MNKTLAQWSGWCGGYSCDFSQKTVILVCTSELTLLVSYLSLPKLSGLRLSRSSPVHGTTAMSEGDDTENWGQYLHIHNQHMAMGVSAQYRSLMLRMFPVIYSVPGLALAPSHEE